MGVYSSATLTQFFLNIVRRRKKQYRVEWVSHITSFTVPNGDFPFESSRARRSVRVTRAILSDRYVHGYFS